METDDDTHGFPLAREGDHLDDLGRLASFLPILPTEVLGKLKKGGLGLGSYEGKLFGLGIDVFKGSRVDRDGLVEQALQLRREDCVDVVLFDREIVGVFAIYLGLVSVGDILFLGLILLLIGCVRAGLVLLEVVDEFGMDTDGAGDDAHDVLGECSGLVGADHRGACHCFMAKASARVIASGRPSGTATTTSVTEMMSMRVKTMPFSKMGQGMN